MLITGCYYLNSTRCLDHSSWTYIHGSLNTSAKVKLHGHLGDSFSVNQGVGQGKITSTHSYKVYIDGLLHRLTHSGQGAYIGDIYIGSPTCADDVILVANNIIELQSQLNIVSDYTKRERYQIHPDKSKLIVFGITKPAKPMLNEVSQVDSLELCDTSATILCT